MPFSRYRLSALRRLARATLVAALVAHIGSAAFPAHAVPDVTATKSATLVNDINNNNLADPGDTVQYSVTITNNGISDATGVVFADTLPNVLTLVHDSQQSTPLTVDDTYVAGRNTQLAINAPGVLTNDLAGTPVGVLTAINSGATAQGGTVTLNADGSFTYTPPNGYSGTDSFTYTLTNSLGSSAGTVVLVVEAMPEVTTTVPADNAQVIPTNTTVTINFSEPVTFTEASFTFTCNANLVSFTVSSSPASSAVLTPAANLPEATTCTVTVLQAGITDVDTNDPPDTLAADYVFDFTTDGAPGVESTTPANNAVGVALDANLVITFSEPVNVTGNWFGLVCTVSGSRSIGANSFVVTGGPTTFTLNPNSNFAVSDNCTGTVFAAQVTDQDAGDPPETMAANYVFDFSAGSPPVAVDDDYGTVVGNIGVAVLTAGEGVLQRGTDDTAGVTLTLFGASTPTTAVNGTNTITTANGGYVLLYPDGTFIYGSAPGYEGPDSFVYRIENGFGMDDATVTINVNEVVWFVNLNAATNQDGRQGFPYNTLAALGGVDLDEANDVIYVQGTGASSAALTLEAGQRLVGQGVSLASALAAYSITLSPFQAIPGTEADTAPALSNTATILTLANGNDVRGLALAPTGGSAISATGTSGNATLNNLTITLSGTAQAFGLTNVAGNFTVSNSSVTTPITTTGVAVNINGGAGVLAFNNTSVTQRGGGVVRIQNKIAGSVTFDSQSSLTGTAITSGSGVGVLDNGSVPTTFSGPVDLAVTNNPALDLLNTGTVTIDNTNNVLNATNRPALNAVSVSLTSVFSSITSTNSTSTGISLDRVSGTLNSTTTTLTNPATRGIELLNPSLTANFGTTSITDSGGTGLQIQDSFSGTRSFTSLTITPDNGQAGIVTTTATGTLSITTGSITTTSAPAVNIINAALNVTLQSISVTGGVNGVILNNTTGTFVVTGTGSTNGSGGTIQNTTNYGVRLTNAAGVTLNNLNLNNAPTADSACIAPSFADCNAAIRADTTGPALNNVRINGSSDQGIVLYGANGFSMSGGLISLVGNSDDEFGILALNARGTYTLNNALQIVNPYERALYLDNSAGTPTLTLNVNNVTFQGRTPRSAEEAALWLNFDSNTTATVNVNNSAFSNTSGGIRLTAGGNNLNATTLNLTVADNTFSDSDGDSRNPAVQLLAGTIGGVLDPVNLRYLIARNTFDNYGVSGVDGVSTIYVQGNGGSVLNGTIQNNNATSLAAHGVLVLLSEDADHQVDITNNTLTFDATARGYGVRTAISDFAATGRLDATIWHNDVNMANAVTSGAFGGIRAALPSTPSGAMTLCLNLTNNNATGNGLDDFELISRGGVTTFIFQGITPSPVTSPTNVVNHVLARSNVPGRGTSFIFSNASAGTPVNNGTCARPTMQPPSMAQNLPEANPMLGTESAALSGGSSLPEQPTAPIFARPLPADEMARSGVGNDEPQAGETLNLNIGTLNAGKRITIRFRATLTSALPANGAQVCSQGTVSGSNITSVLTDDPGTGTANDPTCFNSAAYPVFRSVSDPGVPLNLNGLVNRQVTIPFVISNIGGVGTSLTVTQASLSAGFSVTGLPATVAQNGPAQSINVRCTPAAGAPVTGTLVVTTNEPGSPTYTYNLTCSPARQTVGIYRPSNGTFYLRFSNTTGFADTTTAFGIAGDLPVVGDWDGDGVQTLGIFRPSTGLFQLRNSNLPGAPVAYSFFFGGAAGDLPVVGDWDNNGTETIGIFRSGEFHLRNTLSTGPANTVIRFGTSTDLPVAGDWDNNGFDTPGVYRPSTAQFFLSNTAIAGVGTLANTFTFGAVGDLPMVGDWNADGVPGIGVYRPSSARLFLRNAQSTGFADIVFVFGIASDHPLAGAWLNSAGTLPAPEFGPQDTAPEFKPGK